VSGGKEGETADGCLLVKRLARARTLSRKRLARC